MKERVIGIVKSQGPLLPTQVAKAIGTNIIMASAYLSELVSNKSIKISSLKVGGSPLYYAPGQEEKLQNFADNLNEKERNTFELLKDKKILRDISQEPVVRVALRQMRDFAVPLRVQNDDQVEIFWKWYLTPEQEIESRVKGLLQEQIKKPEQQVRVESQSEIEKSEKEPIREEKPKKPEEEPRIVKDNFQEQLNLFFSNNKIGIIESNAIRKNSEIDLVLDMPSPVGKLRYYCKAKNKKRVSDSDLSNAYVQGQIRKLPVLFLSSGELSKKASELLDSELKGLTYKKL